MSLIDRVRDWIENKLCGLALGFIACMVNPFSWIWAFTWFIIGTWIGE